MKTKSRELPKKENKKSLYDMLRQKFSSVQKYLQTKSPLRSDELLPQLVLARLRLLNVRMTLRIMPADQIERLRQVMPKRLIVTISASDLMEYSYFEAKPIGSGSQMQGLQFDESSHNVHLCETVRLG